MAALPASSVTLIWSLPSSESLSQELTVLDAPAVVVKVRTMAQVEDVSSFQVAMDVSPILSSLPDTVTAGEAITLAEPLDTEMVGAWVSFGVGGVGGSITSLPPQDARAIARRMTDVSLNQRIFIDCLCGLSARRNVVPGIRMPTPTERTVFLRLSPGGSRADLPRYPYRAYYSVLSIPRPCAALSRPLLCRISGL